MYNTFFNGVQLVFSNILNILTQPTRTIKKYLGEYIHEVYCTTVTSEAYQKSACGRFGYK